MRRLVATCLGVLCAAALAAPLAAEPEEVQATVAYVAEDALYVDQGSAAGLEPGDLGVVRRGGVEVAAIEIVSTTRRQARARILRQSEAPLAGDRVIVKVRRASAVPDEDAASKAGPGEIAAPEAFMPLLERQRRRAKIVPPQNIFHGRVGATQLVQVDEEGELGYATTLLSTHGMLDRINGTPWALRWSANASLRSGDAFEGAAIEEARLDVAGLELRRRIGRSGRLRLGRFVPQGLGAAGYVDGVGLDLPVGPRLRVGGAAGFKPTREDLTPSAREPVGLAYVTVESSEESNLVYSATAGLFGSAYRGELDRVALMTEQFVSTGPLRVNGAAEIDLETGGRDFNRGVRLTRFDANAAWTVSRPVTLRAGVDHYERLDSAAERAMLEVVDPTLFDDAFWRYWGGFRIAAPGRLHLDAEIARIAGGSASANPNWRVSLTHSDPLGAVGGYVSLTVYNLESLEGDGFGGLLDGTIPLNGGRWMLRPGVGLRSFDTHGATLELTDAHLHVDFLPTPVWELHAGLSYLSGTAVDSVLVELGAAYRW